VDGDGVGLGREGEDSLDGDVHDHDTLGTEMERQDLQSIGDKETRETDGVEDTEDPDKDNLADTEAFLLAIFFVHSCKGSPDGERYNHTWRTYMLVIRRRLYLRNTYQQWQSGIAGVVRLCRRTGQQ
jgi:hypothetical protein